MISLEEMRSAVERSGYLIEQRVSEKLVSQNYSVNPNQIIVDPITDVRREIDLVAISMNYDYDNKDHYGYELICECENNQVPVVFFTSKIDKHRYLSELRCSGFKSMWTYFRDSHKSFPVATELVSTQYCSFNKVKPKGQREERWIALHHDAQHNTFDKLKKSVQHRVPKFEPDTKDCKHIAGRIHYPLLVLSQSLFQWDSTNPDNPLVPADHIVYRVQDFNDEKSLYENYYVDVITEAYLDVYIERKRREWAHLDFLIKSNREAIIEDQKRRNYILLRNRIM